MANPKHLAILQDGVAKNNFDLWNEWHMMLEIPKIGPFPDIFKVDLTRANLRGVNLYGAVLRGVNLHGANLSGADMHQGSLFYTRLSMADLSGADLREAELSNANLFEANLRDADFTNAKVEDTQFSNVDLSMVIGLDSIVHKGPSTIGIDTLYLSRGQIPEIFLRGCGVPETMITFAKSLVGKAIEYYSCFISYSSADEMFARRLHNDLQANGVRVWFAPEDLKIGDPLKQTIDESIKLYDKLIIVLSENSINRAWVRHEVTRALEKEKKHNKLVLFPIRLDNSVFDTTEQWAYEIKDRHIGDFRDWTNPLLYQNSINRLLRDLNAGS